MTYLRVPACLFQNKLALIALLTLLTNCGPSSASDNAKREDHRSGGPTTRSLHYFIGEGDATAAGQEPLPESTPVTSIGTEPLPSSTPPPVTEPVGAGSEPLPTSQVPSPSPMPPAPDSGETPPATGSDGSGGTSPSPGSTPGPTIPDMTTGDPLPPPAPGDTDLAECAKTFRISAEHVHVAGRHNVVHLGSDTVMFVKVTGTENQVFIDVTGETGTKLAGLCVFLAGNKARITIKSDITLAHLFYKGRGNQSEGSVEIQEGGALGESEVDLAGNGAKVRIFGTGDYACPSARLRGRGTSVTCD